MGKFHYEDLGAALQGATSLSRNVPVDGSEGASGPQHAFLPISFLHHSWGLLGACRSPRWAKRRVIVSLLIVRLA